MSDSERYLEAIESAKASGKLKKGVNEVTKELERGNAKLVVAAADVSPKEIIMHLPILAKEKGILYGEVASKEELGAAAGLPRPTAAIAIMDIGKAKDILKELQDEARAKAVKEAPKEEVKEEPAKEAKAAPAKEEKVEEAPVEEKAEEVKEEAPVEEEKAEESPKEEPVEEPKKEAKEEKAE